MYSNLAFHKISVLVINVTKEYKNMQAAAAAAAKSLQSCLTLCDPIESSPQGSSVHGIFQARILEWVTRPSSRGSFLPRG